MRLLFTTAARSTRCKRATGPTRSLVAGKYLRAKARGLRSSGQRGGSSSQVQHMVDLSGATDRLSRGGGTGQAYPCFKSQSSYPYGTAKPCSAVASMRSRVRRSEEHTSELQSLMRISYAVLCLTKTK